MKWKTSPPALVQLFENATSGIARAEKKQMFGYPCLFLNGNLALGLHQDRFILRLSAEERREFLNLKGASVFEPMKGRPMKEYVVAPASLVKSPERMDAWIQKSLAYVESLPAKVKKRKTRAR